MSGVVKIEITESTEALKELLGQVSTSQARERVQALYWLKTKTVNTVYEIAALLGRNRVTVQRWLSKYRSGGMECLLEERKSSGRPRKIPPEVVEKLELELGNPQGFNSYGEIQLWLKIVWDIDVSYRTVHQLVRYELKAKLKVPRPVHLLQKPGAVSQYKKTLHAS